jgi:hypothetical protein
MWYMENRPHILLFSGEAGIHLSRYVKYQRPRAPILIHKLPLRGVNTGMWCAVSATRITAAIFLIKSMNSHEYVTHMLKQFSEDMFD